jgi:peptidoglycan hydrolase-like protein with peptidoglycan-binding domain
MNTIRTRASLGAIAALFSIAVLGLGASTAFAAISGSLDFGATGPQVVELQTYLATNASIYPEGLITGYFGTLTRAAVQRFQSAEGIVSSGTPSTTGYGRVGPLTALRINTLMGGGASNVSWDTVPVMSPVSVLYTSTSATFTWSTNEPTRGQVYWSTSPIIAYEATGPNQQPFVSGTLAADAGGVTSHSITVSGMQANTTYYYLVRVLDSGNNITVMWPPGSFRTSI